MTTDEMRAGSAEPVQPPIPRRAGPRPATLRGMPHMQIGVQPVPEVNAELFRRAFSLSGVQNRPTIIGLGDRVDGGSKIEGQIERESRLVFGFEPE